MCAAYYQNFADHRINNLVYRDTGMYECGERDRLQAAFLTGLRSSHRYPLRPSANHCIALGQERFGHAVHGAVRCASREAVGDGVQAASPPDAFRAQQWWDAQWLQPLVSLELEMQSQYINFVCLKKNQNAEEVVSADAAVTRAASRGAGSAAAHQTCSLWPGSFRPLATQPRCPFWPPLSAIYRPDIARSLHPYSSIAIRRLWR